VRPRSRRSENLALAGFLGGLFAIYMAARPLCLHVSDSYAWVNTVETGSFAYFFHPHHVLYVPLAWRWHQLAELLAPGVSAWTSLAALSAAFGCAGAAALFKTVRLLGGGVRASLLAGALPAFTFGYWFFSSEPEVYVASACFCLWTFYFLAAHLEGSHPRAALWAGVAAGLAALMHQTGIFLFLPAIVVLARGGAPGPGHLENLPAGAGDTGSSPRRRAEAEGGGLPRERRSRWRAFAAFAGVFGLVVAPVYLAAFWAQGGSLLAGAFAAWVFRFGVEGYGSLSARAPLEALVGLARAVVGGQAVLDVLRGARGASGAVILGAVLSAGAALSLLWLCSSGLRRLRWLEAHARRLVLAAAMTFAVYGIFSVCFDPANFEWWTIPGAVLALALSAAALVGERPALGPAMAAVVLLLGANWLLDFSPRRDRSNDLLLSASDEIAALTAPEDVILAPPALSSALWYEHRDRRILAPEKALRRGGQKQLRAELRRAAVGTRRRGGRVVVAGVRATGVAGQALESITAEAGCGEGEIIGRFRWFGDSGAPVRRVTDVGIRAFEPEVFLESGGGTRLAGEVSR